MYAYSYLYYLKPQKTNNQQNRGFHPIQFVNGYRLSIQFSYAHYCLPRKTLSITEYSHGEIAFFYEDLGIVLADGGAVPEELVKRLKPYEQNGVYAYVPVALIEEVFHYMAKNHKLNPKSFRL